ncbi:endoplasmin-like [Paramacrobiotus metropolitanus]|uniref:endoplasmin-like n=1 Tax=Paramacrobiotus metropolitanus TaxID=2943436 RepID=UPI002445F593|nr:endoplasmin-like [Paramacrobiotus metropolitanus]XP_055353709.1 endoplasmin-like [Paramacrobiotus metropolitanus]
MNRYLLFVGLAVLFLLTGPLRSHGKEDDIDDEEGANPKVQSNVGKGKQGSRTDDEVVAREEEAIKIDGLNVAQMKEMRDRAEKHVFQAEVDRMMKLIINSLYKNKEIFLRELISNASDALDKIRIISLTDKSALDATPELSVRVKADKENHVLHITDTGVGMTKDELIKNLGTIARSGTNEFFQKLSQSSATEAGELIGQFGVGFYSAFLVADRVVVTSKSNSDKQYIWESDAASFSIAEDPRGDSLKRGTTVSLHLKEEAYDFLEENTIKELVKKYSQFINFPIHLWGSKTETVEEPAEDDESSTTEAPKTEEDEEAKVEEAPKDDDKKKTKKVEKTIWDWILMNELKPIWTRKPADVSDKEYFEFYKSFTKDYEEPMAKIHFTAEGEVSFKSILYIPKKAPTDAFQKYGTKTENIKLYVRRVFITDDLQDIIPKYLNFIRGVVDSDDLPLNVSRETLQQNKLIKLIRKKIVRKVLDMIKKLEKEDAEKFWTEYSTNLKLGVIEDSANRSRLAKLLKFQSSNGSELVQLPEYVTRMKPKQEHIYYMAAASRVEAEKSPFVERLLQRGYEVLYLTDPVDEYCMQSLPEFEGKKFQNAAKEGLNLGDSDKAEKRVEELTKQFEPLTNWLQDKVLKEKIDKATISQRLTQSPCALVAKSYGWTGNMERIMRAQAYAKSKDPMQEFYATQKRTMEINPGHPIIKDMLRRVEENEDDDIAKDLAVVLYETSAIRSGFQVPDTAGYFDRVEKMLRLGLNISPEEKIEEFEEFSSDSTDADSPAKDADEDKEVEEDAESPVKDEL